MKIRKVTADSHVKQRALLIRAFAPSSYEARLVDNLHRRQRELHEWVCIHKNRVIACIVFSRAYNDGEVCGLHLGPLAVNPEFQNRGVGAELLRYALRQEEIKSRTVYVLGKPAYYRKFGFELCRQPRCPFDTDNKHFLALRNSSGPGFSVGYEPEFLSS